MMPYYRHGGGTLLTSPHPLPTMTKLTKQQLLADQARLDAHWAKHAKRTDHLAEARRLNHQDKAIDRGLAAWW